MKGKKKGKEIFNPEQKQEYMNYDSPNENALRVCFYSTKDHEERYGKDIADMGEEELRDTLVSLNIRRNDTRSTFISLLRGYVSWAKLMGKTNNASAIFNINAESVGSKQAITEKMIKSPEQVEHILNVAIDTTDEAYRFVASRYYQQENRATRDKLAFWLLYSGLFIQDLIEMKKNDINFTDKIILGKDGIVYELNDTVISLWKAYCDAESLEKAGTRGNNKAVFNIELQDNDYLFRNFIMKGQENRGNQSYNSFINILKKIFNIYELREATKLEVLPEDIRTSGIFYKLYLKEKCGEDITNKTLAKYFGRSYNKNQSLAITPMARKWRIDYTDWKVAFGYM